ncbi:interaptin-like isoform X2 [Xenia sp. Carnegie-2017]|uniref:interaptin-like isoform X2 n=1 Tax=Xenia sp. Carnegie-2017 TaxID=2897299 RepID=UPI001F03DCC4|nr:interaptin-like isoform X2 [Xenia sp. Carnegie-2017]
MSCQSVTRVQEFSLKVKHFIPPVVQSPEIFVLYGNHETMNISISSASALEEYEQVRGNKEYTKEKEMETSTGETEMKTPTKCSSSESKTREIVDMTERRVHFIQHDGNDNENNFPIENNVKKKEELVERDKAKTVDDVDPFFQQFSANLNEKVNEVHKDHPGTTCDELNSNNLQKYMKSNDLSQQRKSPSFKDKTDKTPRDRGRRKKPLPQSKTDPSQVQTSLEKVSGINELRDDMETKNENVYDDNELVSRKIKSEENCDQHMKDELSKVEVKSAHSEDDNTKDISNHKISAVENNDYESNGVVDVQKNVNNDKNSRVVFSTKKNMKHSAENSVASSGFESLNTSNDNRFTVEQPLKDIENKMAEKENIVLELQAELNDVRNERSNSEKAREQLLKKVKNLQDQNNKRQIEAKSLWKKRYFEEKKKTVSLEERCNQLRYDVEVVHNKILSYSNAKERDSASSYLLKDGDPKKLNAKILLSRKENEVEELRRRVEEAKIKLGSEMKLRDNAQKELKQIRDEVIDKKINATLVKKSLSLLETQTQNDV